MAVLYCVYYASSIGIVAKNAEYYKENLMKMHKNIHLYYGYANKHG